MDHTETPKATYQQDTEFALLEAIIPFVREKTFLDIGAEKGSFSSHMFDHGFHGVLFEPFPGHRQPLESLVSGGAGRFYPYAIDQVDHAAQFFIAVNGDGQDLDYYHSLQSLEGDSRVRHGRSIDVDCKALSTLVDEGVIDGHVGIIKTDTEGNDLNVIRGMGPLTAEVLMCEFFTTGLYAGWQDAQPERLIAAAAEKGFNRFVAVKRRADSELVSISPTIFVSREWGNLIFMTDEIYCQAEKGIQQVMRAKEEALFAEIEVLRQACDERLALVNELHEEAEKRLKLILELDRQLHAGGKQGK